MRIRTAAPLFATLLIFAAPAVMAAERVFDRSFPVTPGGLLQVNADGAAVVVAGGDADQVIVHIAVTGTQKNVDALKLSAESNSDGVTVEALRPNSNFLGMSWSWSNMDARIKVTVPRRYRVELKTSGGNLTVSDLQGDASGKTSGGDVELENVTGKVQMRTSGGNMKVARIKGAVKLNTSGGDIVASNVQGDTDVDTSGGDVRLLGVDGKIHASTSGGSVHCVLVGANRGISASTSGGNISLQVAKDITATLDASSSGGKVSSELPVSVSTTSGKRLSGPINGGGEPIYARTSGGDIELRVSR